MNQTSHYKNGIDCAPEMEFLQHMRWGYIYDLSYNYDKKINLESEISRTENIYGVLDLFSRLAGIKMDNIDWAGVVEQDSKGLQKYHHHLLIGMNGLNFNNQFQKDLLSDCWQHLYRKEWHQDWKEANRYTPNRIKNKILREKYKYFLGDRDFYLGKDRKSPIAFNIMSPNTFIDKKYRNFLFNGVGQANVQIYDKEKFWTNGVGYRLKRPVDPETKKPLVQTPVFVDMSPHLKRYWINKRKWVIPEIDHKQKFFSKQEPGALHPFRKYGIIPDNPGFDLRIIGLSSG